jgi:two-component system, NtrC family, sensor histidine kinase KinB
MTSWREILNRVLPGSHARLEQPAIDARRKRIAWVPGSMLRTRLFLNLLPFVAILLAISFYAIGLFSRLANTIDTTVTENNRSIMAVQAMSRALQGMEKEAWDTAVARSADSKASAEEQQRFEENLALQLKNFSVPGEKELNQQLAADYETFREAMITLNSAGNAASQHQVYDQEIVPRVRKMEALLLKIRDLNQHAILATSQSIQKITRAVTRLMVIGVIIALAISAYAYYRFSRSILQPIHLLTKATRELGEGKLNQPVPVIFQDELGELALAFNAMAAQLHEYRQSTTEEIVRLHRTMETTLASFPDPIFVLNRAGQIELKNPAANDLASGLHLGGQLPGRLRAIAQKSLENGENFLPHSFDEVISYRISRTEKFFLPRILAMRDKENTLFGVAVVLYDVTRFRLLDAVKTNLVATVSHELKTPLTGLRMVLHILLEKTIGSLTPKQNELLLGARNDAERMLRILNDLLDLTRLEQGNAALKKEKVNPGELIKSVMSELGDKILAQGLKVNCIVAAGLPPVSVDRQRISHVFGNLIINAIKHSPVGGEIVLRAALAEDNDVEFSVTDHGPGIPEEHHTRIFDRFFRVPGQTKPGAGLGLSIAKEITVAHGGRIGVRSAPGHGSTFYVFLKSDGAARR